MWFPKTGRLGALVLMAVLALLTTATPALAGTPDGRTVFFSLSLLAVLSPVAISLAIGGSLGWLRRLRAEADGE